MTTSIHALSVFPVVTPEWLEVAERIYTEIARDRPSPSLQTLANFHKAPSSDLVTSLDFPISKSTDDDYHLVYFLGFFFTRILLEKITNDTDFQIDTRTARQELAKTIESTPIISALFALYTYSFDAIAAYMQQAYANQIWEEEDPTPIKIESYCLVFAYVAQQDSVSLAPHHASYYYQNKTQQRKGAPILPPGTDDPCGWIFCHHHAEPLPSPYLYYFFAQIGLHALTTEPTNIVNGEQALPPEEEKKIIVSELKKLINILTYLGDHASSDGAPLIKFLEWDTMQLTHNLRKLGYSLTSDIFQIAWYEKLFHFFFQHIGIGAGPPTHDQLTYIIHILGSMQDSTQKVFELLRTQPSDIKESSLKGSSLSNTTNAICTMFAVEHYGGKQATVDTLADLPASYASTYTNLAPH